MNRQAREVAAWTALWFSVLAGLAILVWQACFSREARRESRMEVYGEDGVR